MEMTFFFFLLLVTVTIGIFPRSASEKSFDCLPGQEGCPAESELGVLMVVGGSPPYFKVEAVDLSGANRTCPQIADFPGAGAGSVGIFIGGKAMVCGGFNAPITSKCFTYDPLANEWTETVSMNTPREYSAAVKLSPTEWWITGGEDAPANRLASTEVYTVGGEFKASIDLPEEKSFHNVVKINASHCMLLGNIGDQKKVWIVDTSADAPEWKSLPDLLERRPSSHAGLVTYADGRQAVVVAAGIYTKSTEIFDFDNQAWRYGPDLPVESHLFTGASVQYGNTFMIVGGYDGDWSDSIYRFDADKEAWVELPQKLHNARYHHAAFLVPDSHCLERGSSRGHIIEGLFAPLLITAFVSLWLK